MATAATVTDIFIIGTATTKANKANIPPTAKSNKLAAVFWKISIGGNVIPTASTAFLIISATGFRVIKKAMRAKIAKKAKSL